MHDWAPLDQLESTGAKKVQIGIQFSKNVHRASKAFIITEHSVKVNIAYSCGKSREKYIDFCIDNWRDCGIVLDIVKSYKHHLRNEVEGLCFNQVLVQVRRTVWARVEHQMEIPIDDVVWDQIHESLMLAIDRAIKVGTE